MIASSELWQRGRAAWPQFLIEESRFTAYLNKRSFDADPEDLYLACACCLGLDPAIEAFERRHRVDIAAALGKMALPPSLKDDITQEILTKLFVGESGTSGKINSFTGRGRLRSWVRAVAVRAALDALRGENKDEVPSEESFLEGLKASVEDPELDWLKQNYKKQVNDALAKAFAALDSRQRVLLRHHYLDGLNIDRLGVMYGVHRVTAFRWLCNARAKVLEEARSALAGAFQAGELSADEILKLLRSQIDVTIERLLG